MDLVDNSQDVYNNIVIDYAEVAKKLGLKDITYIPISAINGDNIVEKSPSLSLVRRRIIITYFRECRSAK